MPFRLHFCSIFGLGSLLNTHLDQKRGFSRKPLKTNEKSIFLTPRRIGNQPEIAPRRLQEVTFSLLNLHLFFLSIYSPFGLPKCLPLDTLFAPKIVSKNHKKNQVPQKSPQDHTISPQDGPRSPQEAPRGSQEPPKRLPRSSKSTLRGFKNTPKSLEECLRSPKGTASGLNKTKQHPDGN